MNAPRCNASPRAVGPWAPGAAVLAKALFLTALLTAFLTAAPRAQSPAAEPLQYAKVTVAELQPRCFAGPKSPLYGDRLTEGAVVRVGATVGDYQRLVLPLGVTGYVHKKFTAEPVEGMVEATASNVSFRYRPTSSEVPALVMPKGTKLYLVADVGDWWQVSHPGAPAYIARADVQAFATPSSTLEASFEQLRVDRRARWTAAVLSREQQRAAAAALVARSAELDAIVEGFGEVTARPLEQQDFGAVELRLTALLGDLAEGTPQHLRAVRVQREIERQKLLARAIKVVAEPAPTRDEAAEILPAEVGDPLARFDAVGWLRHHASSRAPDYFTLEKGGRLLYVVTCTGGRYDLRMFDGVEVGITGSKSRPAADKVREVDALKLEVLQLGR